MNGELHKKLMSVRPAEWRKRHLIVLDFYDGATEGVCILEHPSCMFYFKMIGERWRRYGRRELLFTIMAFPDSAIKMIDEYVDYRAAVESPNSAVLVDPVMEERINPSIASHGEPFLIVRTTNIVEFTSFSFYDVMPNGGHDNHFSAT